MIPLPVKNIDIAALKEIFARFSHIDLAVLFGSRVGNDAHPFSDYDFAIVYRGDVSDFARLWVEIAHAMDIDVEDIDLVDFLRAGESIKREIAYRHILIKGSENELVRLLGTDKEASDPREEDS
ncbi:nucleotidyltransferase domain-containing protein [Nitratiruptor tergarcus]|uniref:Nucleotidyltransferase domain-containing protein n=1 Tax=Nitratiruptor tergarcus DSM 16512 TaxID=1069081 RepID=A0A1W1WU00_9BACT|nr:nucleotidyltransferase domain-containing protein [Nitratiruptor tergarcus]SMC09510.1 Nucleotidyltransferase domain-containing protein [Nitratiruptor tergarcus DSM 16512]